MIRVERIETVVHWLSGQVLAQMKGEEVWETLCENESHHTVSAEGPTRQHRGGDLSKWQYLPYRLCKHSSLPQLVVHKQVQWTCSPPHRDNANIPALWWKSEQSKYSGLAKWSSLNFFPTIHIGELIRYIHTRRTKQIFQSRLNNGGRPVGQGREEGHICQREIFERWRRWLSKYAEKSDKVTWAREQHYKQFILSVLTYHDGYWALSCCGG